MKLTAYSTLIHQDLACISAKEAIRHILHYSPLIDLKRFTRWEFELAESDQNKAKLKIESLFTKTYYLINPNKEKYTFQLPTQTAPGAHQLSIALTPRSAINWASVIEKIRSKTGISVENIRSATVWTMTVSTDNRSPESIQKELTERVISAQSVSKGILVNPVSETFEWI